LTRSISKNGVEIEIKRGFGVFAKEVLMVVGAGKGDCPGDHTGNLWMSEHFGRVMERRFLM